MANSSEPYYKEKFFQADEDGNYVSMGSQYRVSISETTLTLAKTNIPLLRVLQVERVGKGVSIIFLDANKVRNKVVLTTSNIFGIAIGRAKKLDGLVEELEYAIQEAKDQTSAEVVEAAQKVAPPDTCHDCGERGGAPLKFGEVMSFVHITRWTTPEGIYCEKHATTRGLRGLLITSTLGWWSFWGIFITPACIAYNIRSLWVHSKVPKLIVLALAVASVLPIVALYKFFMNLGSTRR